VVQKCISQVTTNIPRVYSLRRQKHKRTVRLTHIFSYNVRYSCVLCIDNRHVFIYYYIIIIYNTVIRFLTKCLVRQFYYMATNDYIIVYTLYILLRSIKSDVLLGYQFEFSPITIPVHTNTCLSITFHISTYKLQSP